MKYTKEIYDRLAQGGFISGDSRDAKTKQIFINLQDNFQEYYDYFSQIGLDIECGDGFYYFSRKLSKKEIPDKLKKFGHWIDIIDLLVSLDPTIGPGSEISITKLSVGFETDIELRDKARKLYDKDLTFTEIAMRLLEELRRQGFIEMTDEMMKSYIVLSSFKYLFEMVELIVIETSEDTPDHETTE